MMSVATQKRIINAGNRGYEAAILGDSIESCPYVNVKNNAVRFLSTQWRAGWREGMEKVKSIKAQRCAK